MNVQIIGVQHPAGRKHDYVRVFGSVPNDPKKRTVEFAVDADEAFALIDQMRRTGAFPAVDVEDEAWVFTMYVPDDVRVVCASKQESRT